MAERDRLRARLEAMDASGGELDPRALRSLRDLAATSLARLAASGDYDRQREVLGRLVECVEVHGASIVIRYRGEVLEPAEVQVPRWMKLPGHQ